MSAAIAVTACTIPENTLPAFEAAKSAGATSVEIDVVLTKDGEPIILHDLTVDRTTDGYGFAADLTLEEIRELDAGSAFRSAFRGNEDSSLLAEALDWAKRDGMGIVLEIKEAERPDLCGRSCRRAAESDRHDGSGHRHQLRPHRAEARGRSPHGTEDRGDHTCPPRRSRRRAEIVRRELRVDRA